MMIPISLAVTLLQHYGAIAFAARYIDPLFRLMGLPGESAVVFITGAALTTYAAVAVLLSLTLTLRQATIISLMVLLCHALPMECTVTRRTGSSFAGMVVLRILMAFAAAFYLNLILPEMPQTFGFATAPHAETTLVEMAENWTVSNLKLSIMIFLIIYAIMIMQNMLQAFNMLDAISKFLRPLMRLHRKRNHPEGKGGGSEPTFGNEPLHYRRHMRVRSYRNKRVLDYIHPDALCTYRGMGKKADDENFQENAENHS